jgi:hypothetical protein
MVVVDSMVDSVGFFHYDSIVEDSHLITLAIRKYDKAITILNV